MVVSRSHHIFFRLCVYILSEKRVYTHKIIDPNAASKKLPFLPYPLIWERMKNYWENEKAELKYLKLQTVIIYIAGFEWLNFSNSFKNVLQIVLYSSLRRSIYSQ